MLKTGEDYCFDQKSNIRTPFSNDGVKMERLKNSSQSSTETVCLTKNVSVTCSVHSVVRVICVVCMNSLGNLRFSFKQNCFVYYWQHVFFSNMLNIMSVKFSLTTLANKQLCQH